MEFRVGGIPWEGPPMIVLVKGRWRKPLSEGGKVRHKDSRFLSPNFYIFRDPPGVDSTESIPCENQFRREIDSREGREGGPENEVDLKINILWDMADLIPRLSPTPVQESIFALWAGICKPFKDPRNPIPSLAGRYDNQVWRTGPPDYIGWRNRFHGIDFWAR